MTETVGSYTIEHVTSSYVRVWRFGVVMFSGTPGAARAYCQS